MSGASLPDPVDFSRGEVRLGPYRLLRPISAGGMARVYEGRLDSLAGVTTRVAVKVIHPDFANEAAFQDLFITEARISARLEHQNLVRIQQFNRERGLYYLVMEYIDGITLRKLISLCRRHRATVPVQLIAEIGRQVCEGLHYAHTLAVDGVPLHLVHRDIKPSNIMLNTHGVAKLLDFGISSAHGATDASGGVKGTWGYMALEQAEGAVVGPAADVFGVAAVLYELATLDPLLPEKDNALIRQRLLEDAPASRAAALGGPYAELGAVLVRALQRDPEARHRSAAAFGRALSTLVVDPVGVSDTLVRMYRELEARDPQTAPQQEKPRSMPTMARTDGSPRILPPPSMPVRFGDQHGVGPAARENYRPKPATGGSRWGATLAAVGLLVIALSVLGFATWQLVFGSTARRSAAPVAQGEPAASVSTSPPATPILPASTPVPPTPTPVPPASAPAVTPVPILEPVASAPTTAPRTPPRTTPSTPTAPPTQPVSDPDVPRIPPPSTPTVPEEPAPVATVAPRVARGSGTLTLSSMPRAQVLIDGEYVRYTPIFQHSVPSGTHTVLLVTEDGRRKSFRVEVAPDTETRKIWLFDEERWSDGD